MAVSNLAPNKKNLFPTFKITSRASSLQGLNANPKLTGLIFLISVDEIRSFLTITSRMPAGDNFRHSCSRGSRTNSLLSEIMEADLSFCDHFCTTLIPEATCELCVIRAFFWPFRATVTQDLSLDWIIIGNSTSYDDPKFEPWLRIILGVATATFLVEILSMSFPFPLLFPRPLFSFVCI